MLLATLPGNIASATHSCGEIGKWWWPDPSGGWDLREQAAPFPWPRSPEVELPSH